MYSIGVPVVHPLFDIVHFKNGQTPGVEPVFLIWIAVFFRRIRTVDHHLNQGYATVTSVFDKMN